MRKHYYIVDGIQPWTKADEAKIDKLVPKGYVGNAVEKLIQQGYVMDIDRMGLYSPTGEKVCNLCSAM